MKEKALLGDCVRCPRYSCKIDWKAPHNPIINDNCRQMNGKIESCDPKRCPLELMPRRSAKFPKD